ncbi:hypothetical protein N7508_006176 [Penicillium antarcticum]|uniref:uncharacterized protein n=1 Tax=Penicillium antarcticum TaxID=416450 RepID=UPI0023854B69|nr:uncharacterized protein N7508_006176 [Penicillium antarcticum]KAJ5301313.1 hypothetical protein N7508_006176 [Penicillium antarcticum]
MYGAMSLLYIMTIYGGMGRHTADLPPEALIITLKSLLSVEITYGTSLGLVKTSIALFFVRIFGAKPSFNVAVSISLFIDITIKDTCGNRPAAFMVAGVMNVVTDLMVISLPLPHVWKLKLNVHKKIGLTSVFGVGVVISVISVVRLISITKLDFTDPTYTLLDPILWTVLEPQLAIVCANMPFFKTIIAAIAPAMGSSADRNMDALGTKTHTVQVNNNFDSKLAKTDVESVSSDEQRLATHAGPYGISVTRKFDVHYENSSMRKQ